MKTDRIPCADCKLRASYDRNPDGVVGRLWHWHTGWCPGWKAYLRSLSEEERADVQKRYHR